MKDNVLSFLNCRIKKEIIDITDKKVFLFHKAPVNVGSTLTVDVKLPDAILLSHFTLTGTIKTCDYIPNNGSSGYLLEMAIGDLSKTTRTILDAYIDFLKRENRLDEAKIDTQGLHQTFTELGNKFEQLMSEVTLLAKHSMRKVTIH